MCPSVAYLVSYFGLLVNLIVRIENIVVILDLSTPVLPCVQSGLRQFSGHFSRMVVLDFWISLRTGTMLVVGMSSSIFVTKVVNLSQKCLGRRSLGGDDAGRTLLPLRPLRLNRPNIILHSVSLRTSRRSFSVDCSPISIIRLSLEGSSVWVELHRLRLTRIDSLLH